MFFRAKPLKIVAMKIKNPPSSNEVTEKVEDRAMSNVKSRATEMDTAHITRIPSVSQLKDRSVTVDRKIARTPMPRVANRDNERVDWGIFFIRKPNISLSAMRADIGVVD
jgi:hypothetical protein